MMKRTIILMFALFITTLATAFSSHAVLSTNFQFVGEGNWSLDGCGGNATPVCSIDAIVPTGSTIEAAFLYSTATPSGSNTVPTVDFDGTVYSGADWTALGLNVAAGLQAYRADVTAQVDAAIGGGSAVPFTFDILSESPNNSIDGQVLAIIYSNPSETFRTIAFLDGFSDSNGDSSFIAFADPLTQAELGNVGFEATLSLGIGFGFQPSNNLQSSIVDINGSSLTTCAGGSDDGIPTNGGLVTVGGIGDDRANDHDCSISNGDDELYSLESFLSAGDTLLTIDTSNPSNDDNIFFAGVSITAEATISNNPDPVPNPVPAPGTLVLVAIGLLGLRSKKA